jgi:hypothetical protein
MAVGAHVFYCLMGGFESLIGKTSQPQGSRQGAPDRIRTCDLCLRRALYRFRYGTPQYPKYLITQYDSSHHVAGRIHFLP